MRSIVLVLIAAICFIQLSFAEHFTGTYQDQQQGITFSIQQGTDGVLQGVFASPAGQFQVQGQGDQHGAYGVIMMQPAVRGFQAQLNEDHSILQLALYEMGADGQPNQATAQRLVLRKVSDQVAPQVDPPSSPPPGGMTSPGGPVISPPIGLAPPASGTAPKQNPLSPGGNPLSPNPGLSQADWQGTYVGNNGQLVLVIQGQQGQYSGFIEAGSERYPFQAQGSPDLIQGMFQANGATFDFAVERSQNGILQLHTADTSYILEPVSAPASNPLGRP